MLRGQGLYAATPVPRARSAVILGNNGAINGRGYELSLNKGKLEYKIINNAPFNMIAGDRRPRTLPRQQLGAHHRHLRRQLQGGGHRRLSGRPADAEVMTDKDNWTGSARTASA